MKQSFANVLVLITVIFMDLLAGMEFDLFVPSFPEIQSQFSLSPFWVEALLSINFLGYCLSLFFVGALGDRFGRKPIILLGLITFIIGTMLCLWAASYPYLLIGRFLQGVGVAAPAILSFLIIADAYPLKKQQFYMAMLNAVMNVSVAIAPIIGSYVTLYFHWQGNFIALLILGVMTLAMTMLFIPAYKLPEVKEGLSLRGYIPIFQSKPLMLLIVSFVFIFVPYWIFVGMSPLLYMDDLGVSLTHFGYYQGSLALVCAVASVLYGFIIHKYDQKKMLSLSGLLYIVSIILIALVVLLDSANPLFITLAIIPFILGQTVPTVILYPLCLNYMPQAKGKVSGLIQGGRLILSAMALQIAGYYYVGSFQSIAINISFFILIAAIMLYFVVKNRDLMNFHN